MRAERAVVLGTSVAGLLAVGGLVGAGAPYFDGDLSKVYISTGGHPLPPSGRFDDFQFVLPSRPLLESHVRQHVYRIGNIEVRDGHDVVEPVATGDRVDQTIEPGRIRQLAPSKGRGPRPAVEYQAPGFSVGVAPPPPAA